VISNLYAAHAQGQKTMGVDIESENNGLLDTNERKIFDVLSVKEYAIKQATQVALTILSVDQIIMSKQAGGPKVPKQNNNWDEDD
jgi:T-complex protein 1 subunit theta